MDTNPTRRDFMRTLAATTLLAGVARANTETIQGFDDTASTTRKDAVWQPISDRKIRVGLVGYGLCQFAAQFYFQNHPNVEVVAVSDLLPERCAELARVTQCAKTYPRLEDLIQDDTIEAVFIATDAPSHAQHAIDALQHGKHVACAVPAVFGSLEDADRLYDAVKQSGRHYMLFETSCYHNDVYAMRTIYKAGGFGTVRYTEGEYYHYMPEPLPSFRDWRVGLPPQWYPTHSNGYHIGVTGGHFTEVSCMGHPSTIPHLTPAGNVYKNPFGTETALFRTSEGGSARMVVSWDTNGWGAEAGRLRGDRGAMRDMEYSGDFDTSGLVLEKPPLPPGVEPGGHQGSHGYLCEEFISALLQDRTPYVDIAKALNMTVAGIVAHESALKDGELLKIPVYTI